MIEQFHTLIERARTLPYGDTKVSLLEEAVRIADTYQDTLRGYEARMDLTDAAILGGQPEKALISFSWCLKQLDLNPMQYNAHKLMWQYKWIAVNLISFPEISLEQIESVFEDVKLRFTELGYNHRTYYKLKFMLAWHRGEFELAEKELNRWLSESQDAISDCYACDLNLEVGFLLSIDCFQEAYEKAKPLIDGTYQCHSVPHSTYSLFLLPLLKNGLWEKAESFHDQGLRLIYGKQGYLWLHAVHLRYLSIVDLNKAISLLEKTLPEALSANIPDQQFEYFLSAAILLDELDKRAQKLVQMPEEITLEWLWEQVYDLAKQFDERNMTTHYHNMIQKSLQTVYELKRKYASRNKSPEILLDAEIPFESSRNLSTIVHAHQSKEDLEQMFQIAKNYFEQGDFHSWEKWLKKAADAGHLDSQYHLSETLLNAASSLQERMAGEKMLRELAETGHDLAMNRLGFRLLHGLGIPSDPSEGIYWIKRSVDRASPIGMFQYSLCFFNGIGVEQDIRASEYWMRESAEEGYVPAIYVLGTRLLDGEYISSSPDEGEYWLRKAAEENYLPAMHQLGSRLVTGEKLTRNSYEGHYWLKKAAELDYPPAIHELAFRLLDGDGLKKDPLQGEVLLRRAALLGEIGAMIELAGRLLYGDGMKKKPREGFQWLRKAAISQHPNAMYLLGCYLLDHPELEMYQNEAIVWLHKAAEAGYEKALFLLRELGEDI